LKNLGFFPALTITSDQSVPT